MFYKFQGALFGGRFRAPFCNSFSGAYYIFGEAHLSEYGASCVIKYSEPRPVAAEVFSLFPNLPFAYLTEATQNVPLAGGASRYLWAPGLGGVFGGVFVVMKDGIWCGL